MSRDARIDDIALFFSRNGDTISKVWIPHAVYASPDRICRETDAWRDTIFTRVREDAKGSPYYVVNLANLEPPGEPPTPEAFEKERATTKDYKVQKLKPEPNDIVVIPFSDPAHAYLVTQKEYEDEKLCPPIPKISGADLSFMALTEGMVLGNIPKQDLAGMTCYLLNLVALARE